MPPAPTVARASAAAAALKTPDPTPYLRRRGDINASLASTMSAGTAVLQQQASTTAASSAPSSTSSQYSNNGGWFGNVWGGNFSTNWVTWVSIVVLVGLLIGISTARFFYIRRYYPPTWRSYFLPAKGLHINRFGIHIRGPPPRIPREEPPPYIFATEFGPHGRRRRRRGRQTVGATVGEGGARIGERDQDDMWDVDLVGGADGNGTGPAGTPGLVRDELPRYFVDGGLPMYDVGDGSAAEEAERIRAEAAASGAADADPLETLPTAAEYEAASRAARNNAAESGDAHVQSQQDRPRGEEGVDNNADGAAAYPPRPPPVARTTTGRSSILGAFTRGGNLQRPPLTTNPSGTAVADDDVAGSSSASTSTVSTSLDVLPAIRRTASLESGATGSSSSVDQDPLGKGPVTRSKPNRPGLREASSSMVKIDAGVAHKEEAATSVDSQEDDGDSHEEERDDAALPDRDGKDERHPDSARDARRD
ncbi:hypothetical protein JCM8115_003875 [Rhodotorula mucilaginosa]